MADLFGYEPNDWRKEYVGMPEYDNRDLTTPAISATFHFASQEDYEAFMRVVSDALYAGGRVFDGRQRKEHKTTWYPPLPSRSAFLYVEDDAE